MLIRKFGFNEFLSEGPCAAALGNFDGVHIGHRALVSKAVDIAHSRGIMSAVITFSERPGKVLGKDNSSAITTLNERFSEFEALGVDVTYLFDFSEICELSAKEFVKDVLLNKLNVKHAVCGYNFRFGKNGVGNPESLLDLMAGNATIVKPILIGNTPVSSTLIRQSIENGELEFAAELLGRPFSVNFPVVHGKELGRTIGVPTVNQNFPNGHIVPASGVYISKITVDGHKYSGVSNVGRRPTVENTDTVNLETHIIGFSRLLYGMNLKIELFKKIRDEKKFSSVEELKNQIILDIKKVNDYFGAK